MKRLRLLFVATVGLAAAGCAQATAEDDGCAWRTNLQKARVEARKTGKPMLVVFR